MNVKDLKELVKQTKDLKVLYVEDNKETREQSLKMFKNFFDYIDVAPNGFEALKMYKQKDKDFYSIVISDMNMPVMNGFDMSVEILKENQTQDIIMITAYNDKDHSQMFLDIGLRNYIHKPIQLNALIDSIIEVTS